ncbi:MAG TPA: glycosyltransferase family 4 protein [Pyrinomonadaceae bacterium]|jgi:glycosyltransferase involved in cell wall biosynthesis|nr:glycosyltransferase family 4 protein [Pyrinomonadaceae bacterium]
MAPLSDTPRVLHVVPGLFSTNDGVVGGAERYAFELARHMADEVPTTLVSFGEKDRHESVGQLSVRIIGHPWYVRGQRANPVALSLISELRKADVVHCHQQHIVASSLSAIVCRFSRRKIFVSDLGGGGWDFSAYLSTDRWYHGHLHISEYSRTIYGQTSQSRAHVILGGVDTEKFSPDERVRRDGTILFVGRLLPHKGVNDLVSAIPADLPLELIGQAGDERFIADLRTLAQGKRVIFRHDCNDAELVNSYRRASCVVLPSVYKTLYGDESDVPELLGQTLLEAMACGAPVICTDVASLPEVVEDGVTGFVVPPNNPPALREKLQWLADHQERARAMGHAGRQRVLEKFTWPMVVQRCLAIYATA